MVNNSGNSLYKTLEWNEAKQKKRERKRWRERERINSKKIGTKGNLNEFDIGCSFHSPLHPFANHLTKCGLLFSRRNNTLFDIHVQIPNVWRLYVQHAHLYSSPNRNLITFALTADAFSLSLSVVPSSSFNARLFGFVFFFFDRRLHIFSSGIKIKLAYIKSGYIKQPSKSMAWMVNRMLMINRQNANKTESMIYGV